jgi:hypothetical protein
MGWRVGDMYDRLDNLLIGNYLDTSAGRLPVDPSGYCLVCCRRNRCLALSWVRSQVAEWSRRRGCCAFVYGNHLLLRSVLDQLRS